MDTRDGFQVMRMRVLRTGTFVMTGFLALMVPWRWLGGPGAGSVTHRVVLHAALWMVVMACAGGLLHRWRFRPQRVEAAAFGMMVLGLGVTLTQLLAYGRIQETASTLMVSLASGVVLQRRRSLVGFQVLMAVAWAAVATGVAGGAAMRSWLFDMVLSSIFAFALQELVNRTLAALVRRIRRQRQLLRELHQAMAQVQMLSGLLPICSHCKKIRNDEGYWEQVDTYVQAHSEVSFTHGICPQCADEVRREFGL